MIFRTNRHDLQRSYSQYGEDLIIRELFKGETGTYLDIGAGHPKVGSNTFKFYSEGWRGILVEPIQRLVGKAQVARPEDSVIRSLVGSRASEEQLFYEFQTWQFSTCDENRVRELRQEGREPVAMYYVPTMTVSDFGLQVAPEDPFFLTIDVENRDFDVLKGIDWEQFRPRVICVEELQSPLQSKTQTRELLNSKGYELQSFAYRSAIYMHREFF